MQTHQQEENIISLAISILLFFFTYHQFLMFQLLLNCIQSCKRNNIQFFYQSRQDMKQQEAVNGKRSQFKVILPTKNLLFVHKRLLKDMQDIQNDPVPLCGVAARPLQTDILVWHVNLRGPKKTRFEGAVFHFQIKFPQTYPSHPPTIRSLTCLTHPNVFNGFLCLDFLNLSKQKLKYSSYEWSPVYSVQSILYQLQGFLRNQNFSYDEVPNPVIASFVNSYRCPECRHKGAADPWPPFNEDDSKLNLYRLTDESQKIESSQLKCFYTKLHFTENQLGLGINISKIPKTGLIKEAIIFEDYISIKALLKQSINKTVNKELITHWIPLYFGKVDCAEKFFFFLKKSLSMIMTNSTKYFKPEFVLQVLPKIIINLVYQIMDRNKYVSISLIRILTYVHSIFLYSISKFPELKETIKELITKFIQDEDFRSKDNTPNLGCFLAYLLVSDSFQFSDIINHYFKEQMDRQVFWIMQAVPELISSQLSENADTVRNELAFNCQKTSFHIICLYQVFLNHCKRRKAKSDLLQQYQQNFCRLKTEEENQLQNQIFNIFKTVKTFQDYFQFVGLPAKNETQINQMLKEAIKNSERKKYHKKQDILEWQQRMNLKKTQRNVRQTQYNSIKKADISEQIANYYENIPSYEKFIHAKIPEKMEEDFQKKVQYSESHNEEGDWRALCVERWPWIKQSLINDHSLDSNDISERAFEFYKNQAAFSGQRLYKLHEKYQKIHSNFEQPQVRLPQVSWKTLFLRLDLEDYLKYIDISANFQKFYQRLFVCWKNDVNTLMIPLVEIKNLKSGFYYITALLSRLTTLKYVQFACLPNSSVKLNDKLAKAISKGIHNLNQKNGKLQILSFYNIQTQKDLSQHIFKKKYFNETITSFRIKNCNLFTFTSAVKYFCNLNYPNLEEILIEGCQMNEQRCKILADLLIKLKRLKIFKLNKEANLRLGISIILSNLAFNSSIRVVDVGQITIASENDTTIMTDVIENLGKLIKINSNLEYLILNNIPNLNQSLNIQFWKDLGLSISLKFLDISHANTNNSLSNNLTNLGRAIAFNAKKKGALEYVNFSGSLAHFKSMQRLYEGMNISQYDEQAWYGSPTKLVQMIPENYEKQFYSNLCALYFDNCVSLDPQFSLLEYRQLVNVEEPLLVKLFADSRSLKTLSFKKTGMSRNIADILFLALDQKRLQKCSIKVLNLSQNLIGSEGAGTLASILKEDTILEVIDLSKTGIGVNGIHQISEALKDKQSLRYLNVFNNNIGFDGAKSIAENIVAHSYNLEFLEIGHNRIRGKGLIQLIDAIISNPSSKLMILGLRFNFLTNLSIIKSFKKMAQNKTGLKELFLRNNLMDDFGISELKDIINEANLNISVDILDKSNFTKKQTADKTIWMYPIANFTLSMIKNFFQNEHKCGIITSIRIRSGKMIPNKKGKNKFCLVEFADESSVPIALSLAANGMSQISGFKFRIFKSGTGTFFYRKKPYKTTMREEAEKLLPQLNLPVPSASWKTVIAVKPKMLAAQGNAPPKAQKCEERYLDQIKPKSKWKKRIIKATITLVLIGLGCYFFGDKIYIAVSSLTEIVPPIPSQ